MLASYLSDFKKVGCLFTSNDTVEVIHKGFIFSPSTFNICSPKSVTLGLVKIWGDYIPALHSAIYSHLTFKGLHDPWKEGVFFIKLHEIEKRGLFGIKSSPTKVNTPKASHQIMLMLFLHFQKSGPLMLGAVYMHFILIWHHLLFLIVRIKLLVTNGDKNNVSNVIPWNKNTYLVSNLIFYHS